MHRALPLVLVAGLTGCSLAPFEPTVEPEHDGGRRADAAAADATVVTDARVEPTEGDCTNGSDDDGDGMPDCADPDCTSAGYQCVDDPPAGFDGPGYLSDTGCAAASAEALAHGGAGLGDGEWSCGGCACDGPTGITCSATVSGYSTSSCTALIQNLSVPTGGGCTAASTGFSSAEATTDASGSCTVTAGTSPPTPVFGSDPSFADQLAVCWRGAGTGCGASQRCVLPPPDAQPLCVTRAGDVDCPADYASRRVLADGWDDMRACDDCRCTFNGSCGGSVSAYTTSACSSAQLVGTLANGSDCLAQPVAGFRYVGTGGTGSCRTAGGGATGCAEPTGLTTICCEPAGEPTCPVGRGPAMVLYPGSTDLPAFCIDSTEVTNAQYDAFLASSPDPAAQVAPCDDNARFEPDGSSTRVPDEPVVRVDWCDAFAYCAWAGKRLCSLLDGTTDGTDSDERDADTSEWNRACTDAGTISPSCDSDIVAVHSRPCCRSGDVHDLPGNAEEWTGTCRSRLLGDQCVIHSNQSCSSTRTRRRDDTDSDVGFRCCADPR